MKLNLGLSTRRPVEMKFFCQMSDLLGGSDIINMWNFVSSIIGVVKNIIKKLQSLGSVGCTTRKNWISTPFVEQTNVNKKAWLKPKTNMFTFWKHLQINQKRINKHIRETAMAQQY